MSEPLEQKVDLLGQRVAWIEGYLATRCSDERESRLQTVIEEVRGLRTEVAGLRDEISALRQEVT
jgi:hypothetical protein